MRQRVAIVIGAILCLAGAFVSCENFRVEIFGYTRLTAAGQLDGVGTVVYVSIEGGFYGIVAGKDGRWDPINLPSAYMQDGLKVKFQGTLRKDLSNTHMWGTMVELTSISKL